MAIIALILAALLAFLAARRYDSLRTWLFVGAGACVAFAVYVALTDPAAAWDLRSVERLMGRVVAGEVRQLLR